MIHIPLLSIEIVNGCNLSCLGCSHGSRLEKIKFYSPVTLDNDLKSIVLSPRLIEITGGEPTLHPQLDIIVDVINEFSHVTKSVVRLVTNGVRLKKWESLDIEQVSWSKYPSQKNPEYFGSAKRYKILDRSEFRIQYGIPKNVDQTYNDCMLAHVWKCITLKNSRLYRCGPSIALGAFGVDPTNEIDVMNLINNRPSECSSCLGTSGPMQSWLSK
jgi:organic radical activating enzyme